MAQTKKYSIYESITNVVAGLVLSFLTQLWIYPFCGIKVNIAQNIFITVIFFVISFLRGYTIRRIFVAIEEYIYYTGVADGNNIEVTSQAKNHSS